MRLVGRHRHRVDPDIAELPKVRQLDARLAPMFAAVGTEPDSRADRSHADREIVRHGWHLDGIGSPSARGCRGPCRSYRSRAAAIQFADISLKPGTIDYREIRSDYVGRSSARSSHASLPRKPGRTASDVDRYGRAG